MTTIRTVATLCAALLLVACRHDIASPSSQHAIAPRLAPPAPEPAAAPGRALTAAERALLRPVFGDSVDYDAVRIIHDRFLPLQSDDHFMTPYGSIYAPGPLFVDDFTAAEVTPWRQAMYVHEMTHVWQHQHGVDVVAGALDGLARSGGDSDAIYSYTLAAGRTLGDYTLEQAAALVEDWFLVHVHGLPPYWLRDPPASDQVRDALYAEVAASLSREGS